MQPELPGTVLSREQVRRLDRLASERLGIPSVALMENAGRAVAGAVLELLRFDLKLEPHAARVAVLCGGGNNGGDGYVIARHLHNAGVGVRIFSAADPARLSGDAAVFATVAARMSLPCRTVLDAEQLAAARPELETAHVLVDALLGTGFSGALRPHMAELIAACNALRQSGRRTVAVDLPSGLDCDSGQPSQPTIEADVTVTFVAAKPGFLQPAAQPYLGRVRVAGIGTPPELLREVLG